MKRITLAAMGICVGFALSAQAGTVVSHKTGAKASVSDRYVGRFQAYVDDLEAGGASVRFMGGFRRGHCWSGGLHPCGMALDVCQLSRGVVDRHCNLPGRMAVARIAEAHNLFEGGQWCHSDYGHVQVGESAAACGNFMSAKRRGEIHYASSQRSTTKGNGGREGRPQYAWNSQEGRRGLHSSRQGREVAGESQIRLWQQARESVQ